ncbi:hypothetical protein EDC96DRAFT_436119, partial [Choanephora cucurbitarum]
ISIRGAAKELNLPATTAQSWYKRGMESLEKGENLCIRKSGSGRPSKLSIETTLFKSLMRNLVLYWMK